MTTTATTVEHQRTDQVFAALTIAGGVLAAVGSFTPWVTATSFLGMSVSRSGMDGGGDGLIALITGLLIVAVGVVQLAIPIPSWVARSPIVLSLLLVLIVVVDLAEVSRRISANTSTLVIVSSGPGLYLILVGAMVAAFSSTIVRPKAVS